MNNICKDAGQPLAQKLDATHNLCDIKDDKITCTCMEVIELCDKLAKERHIQYRLEDRLAQYKGKWRMIQRQQWVPHCRTNTGWQVTCHHPCCQQYMCQQTFL